VIGGFRGYFQAVSYYVPYVLSILCIALIANSFNLIDIVELQNPMPFVFLMFPVFLVFIIVSLIALNRTPFDFTEAESEIIAGNYVEYGGMLFGMLYLCEYINLVFSACIISILFLGGWNPIPGLAFLPPHVSMLVKITVIITIMILIRAVLPRYKQEHVIRISWGIFCPMLILYFMAFQSIAP
jgi:NADH-quinone oxidoreductase subunit H